MIISTVERLYLRTAVQPFTVPNGSGMTVAASTAHFVYVGWYPYDTPMNYAKVKLTAANLATLTQIAELGLFSSTTPPNRGNITMTTLIATGTISSLTPAALTIIRNTNSFAYSVPGGTFLWVGFRSNMSVTQPTIQAASRNFGGGEWQQLASSGALTGGGPFSATLVDEGNATGNRPPMMFASVSV